MFEGFDIDCVIGNLYMISMMMCCNIMLIHEKCGVDDKLGSYNHENWIYLMDFRSISFWHMRECLDGLKTSFWENFAVRADLKRS